jgi:hypothetical protein
MLFDFQNQATRLLRRVALALALTAGCDAASATVLHVSIDTSTFGAASGYIDMEFSAIAGAPLATAVVSNLAGFAATPDIQWGVDQVSGGYRFGNDTLNLLSHAATFGGVVSFDLAITGADDPSASYVSVFKVDAFDGANYLGNFEPLTGALAAFLWTPPVAGASGDVVATVFDDSVTVVPEPADLLLMVIGVAAMVLVLKWQRRSVSARDGDDARMAGVHGVHA